MGAQQDSSHLDKPVRAGCAEKCRRENPKRYSPTESDRQRCLGLFGGGVFECHVAGALLQGAEEFGVFFVETPDIQLGLEEAAFVHGDRARVDFALEEPALEDAEASVAIDARGQLALHDHVVHADGMRDDDIRAALDADAARADLAIEPSGGSDLGFAIAKKFSRHAAADVGAAADGCLVVEVAEFFDDERAAGPHRAGDALLDEHVFQRDVRIAVRATGRCGHARHFVHASAFVAAHAAEFGRSVFLDEEPDLLDLRLVAEDIGLGDAEEPILERRHPLAPFVRGRGQRLVRLEMMPARPAERADNARGLRLSGPAFGAGYRFFPFAWRKRHPAPPRSDPCVAVRRRPVRRKRDGHRCGAGRICSG